MGKDYYAILGVSKDAKDEELKKAYKKAALKVLLSFCETLFDQ